MSSFRPSKRAAASSHFQGAPEPVKPVYGSNERNGDHAAAPPVAQQGVRYGAGLPLPRTSNEIQERVEEIWGEMKFLMGQWEAVCLQEQVAAKNATSVANPSDSTMAKLLRGMEEVKGQMNDYRQRLNENNGSSQPARRVEEEDPYRARGRGGFDARGGRGAARGGRGGWAEEAQAGKFHRQSFDRNCTVAVVEFKRGRMKRYLCSEFVEPAQYVIVDGDRGQDCGLVVCCCVRDADGAIVRDEVMDGVTIDVDTIRVERGLVRGIASDEDVCLLHNEIASKEQEALHTCRELVEQMNLQMTVVDCEFQFDRKKISFYFESERPVDFRDLNMELYRIFGVRIWLENQNQQVKHVTNDDRPARGGAGRGGASFRGRR